jgi:hypothetical protein
MIFFWKHFLTNACNLSGSDPDPELVVKIRIWIRKKFRPDMDSQQWITIYQATGNSTLYFSEKSSLTSEFSSAHI